MMSAFPMTPAPVSTYRLQMNLNFTFGDAERLVPYFADLGISHLYLSPIWRARPGSVHGYDICDHQEINPELGGEDGFTRLSQAAAAHGMGIILDFVPNHMCADPWHNRAWREVLRNGPSSPCADYFDVDWRPVKRELQQKVLLPILGRQYGEVLEAGELQVIFENGEFALRYWEHNLPLNPRQTRMILRQRLDELKEALAEDADTLQEYLSVIFQLDHLPSYTEISEEARQDRLREISIAEHRFLRLMEGSEAVRLHIARTIEEFNGKPGDPASFDLLHELLEAQVYRLSYWRTALQEINYRRFFDINELAGLRMEHPEVFEATHAKALELIRDGRAHGLRLDHIDGLYDPPEYLRQLRLALEDAAPGAYVVVEKILSESEPLNESWPVDGTTGYEFLNQLNRLYVQPANLRSIRRFYERFTRVQAKLENVIYASKQQIITTSMASELNVLAHELNRMSEQDRRRRDFTLDSLQEALREVVASFPVYRTYIGSDGVSESDCRVVGTAIREALRKNPAMESSIFTFVRDCLCPVPASGESEKGFARRLRFAMKFQQYTSPVQAKGIEDTAFYRYCPLASLNEVGGDPGSIGAPVADFHVANEYRQTHHPRSMIATSTHDTKRGEDARARINVLSELSEEWRSKLREWSRLNTPVRINIGDRIAPDRNDEYLFYQTLLSVWPVGIQVADAVLVERMQGYMAKAVKEAKIHSSWINPMNEYDEAVAKFVAEVLSGEASVPFLESFLPFAYRVSQLGELNSLSQLTLKIASPGVPDIYQGSEFWDLTLVDPDNRRPVDFELRRNWLRDWLGRVAEWEESGRIFDWPSLPANESTGVAKGVITALGLRFRRNNPDLLVEGRYVPLYAEGPHADYVIAFARVHRDRAVVAAGLRWMAPLMEEGETLAAASARWDETVLPLPPELVGRPLVNLFANEPMEPGAMVPFSRLFRYSPGVLLTAPS